MEKSAHFGTLLIAILIATPPLNTKMEFALFSNGTETERVSKFYLLYECYFYYLLLKLVCSVSGLALFTLDIN